MKETEVIFTSTCVFLRKQNRDLGKWPESAKEKSMFQPDSPELFYNNVNLYWFQLFSVECDLGISVAGFKVVMY